MSNKTNKRSITMTIDLNEEAFEGLEENLRDFFMILIESELEKMSAQLSRKMSIWMFELKYPGFVEIGQSDRRDMSAVELYEMERL